MCSSTFSNGLNTNNIDSNVSIIACINSPTNLLLLTLLYIATLSPFIPFLNPEIPHIIDINEIASFF